MHGIPFQDNARTNKALLYHVVVDWSCSGGRSTLGSYLDIQLIYCESIMSKYVRGDSMTSFDSEMFSMEGSLISSWESV